jgi:hypothetical protein
MRRLIIGCVAAIQRCGVTTLLPFGASVSFVVRAENNLTVFESRRGCFRLLPHPQWRASVGTTFGDFRATCRLLCDEPFCILLSNLAFTISMTITKAPHFEGSWMENAYDVCLDARRDEF